MKLSIDELRRNRWIKVLSKIITLESFSIAFVLLSAGGLINYLLEGRSISASVLITRSMQNQSMIETMTYIIVAAMGFGGLYMLIRSSQPSKIGRESFLVFATGILVLVMAFFLFFALYRFKVSG